MSTTSQGRAFFPLLDLIRGVAAVMVVMHHIPTLMGFHLERGYLAVDLFFVLSGVVVANAYEEPLRQSMSLGRFVWIRLVRLYPLYALGLILGFAATFANDNPYLQGMGKTVALPLGALMVPRFWPLRNDPGNLPITLFPLDAPSWSLFFELAVNFAYAAVVRHLTTRRIMVILGLSGIALIAATVKTGSHSLDIGFRPRQIPLGLVRTCYSFSAGLLIYRFFLTRARSIGARLPRWPATIALVVLVILALALMPHGRAGTAYDLLAVILLFPAIVYCALGVSFGRRATRLFALAGMASYSIYILHAPLSALTTAMLRAAGLPIVAPWYGLVFLVGVVLVATIVDRIYDAPLRRVLRGPSRHRPEVTLGEAVS